MFNSEKSEDEWFDFFYKDIKKAKKNMDDKRFRLMIDRMFSEIEILNETENEIIIEDYVFSKTLANKLLPLANESANFNMMCRFPNQKWLINGFVNDEPFEFEISFYRNRANLDVITKINKKIPPKMKEIVEIFKTWFEESNPVVWLQFSFEANLYLSDNTYTKLLNETIPPYILDSSTIKTLIDNRVLNRKFWRVREFLQTSYEEIISIPGISEYEVERIENFKQRMKHIIED